MKCLWLTLADPEPQHNGQFLYSGGLIDAFADAGADVDVLGLARPGSYRVDGLLEGRVKWRLPEHAPLSPWASVKSRLPNIANRCKTRDMQRELDDLLDHNEWHAIIFDGISAGWALRAALSRYPNSKRHTKFVYVSHNHEMSLRTQIVENQRMALKRQALRFDGRKVTRLEQALVQAADLVTAITPEDRRLYCDQWPEKQIEVLTPGYRGRGVGSRRITRDLPRRAVILGSFDWIAKRMNLQEFLNVADPIFAEHDVELEVIGSGENSFFDNLRRRVSATRFTGTVTSVDSYMDQARVAIVPERNGGGFKLKVLDYVFNRLPIFALDGSVSGVPLQNTDSIRLYPSQRALAEGVLGAIDDIDGLNRLQESAYRACCGAFDWSDRGKQLMSAIAAL